MKNKVALSLAISTIFTFGSNQAAEAVDFQGLLRSYVEKKLGRGGNSQTQQVVKTNINNRQAKLEQEIEAGVKTGQITAEEEKELRNQLVQIAHHESTYLQDGVLQDGEVIKLLAEMNALSQKIQSYLTNKTTTGTGNLSHDEWFRKYGSKPATEADKKPLPNAELRKAHIDTMQAELDSKIQDAVASGYLSWDQARTYLNDLNKIKTDEMNYLRDGYISYTEEQNLLNALRVLRRNVDLKTGYQRNNTWHAVRKAQQPILHQRIANKLSDGKITRQEAYTLYKQESEIHSLEQKLRNGSNLTFEQERDLYRKLDQLTNALESKLAGY